MKIQLNVLININDTVSVTLTEYGAKVINDHNDRIFKGSNLVYQQYEENQQYKSHLWDLMYIFGPTMYMGNNKICFVDNEIRINDSELII